MELKKVEDLHCNKIAVVIDISKTTRINRRICERFLKLLESKHSGAAPSRKLELGLKDLDALFGNEENRLEILRQQFLNLVALSCNIMTIRQGQAVSRLSVLGLIFVPLSFVAVSFFYCAI